MNNPLQAPLVLVADDTGSEIAHRVGNCCKLMKEVCGLGPDDFTKPGSLELPAVEIKWSQSPDAADHLAFAHGRRTLLILDIAWTGISETQGLTIAQALLADDGFASRSIIILKSTEMAGSAASWAEPFNLALRQLRVSQSVRLRLLAADRTVGGETNRYEQGIISQALLDLQEEAIFDAMNDGEWSAADVGKAIGQIVAADFYGAFAGNKSLGRLYENRVLRRYHQRLSPSCPGGPLNIGIAHVMGKKPPTTLQHELDNLTSPKAPESAGIVSALLDYCELAAAERYLFALPLKDNTERDIKTDFDEQTWKPDKIASAKTIKRRCDLSDAQKALDELCVALQSCGKDKAAPLTALKESLHPVRIPDILEANRLIADMRSAVLVDLPAAIAELVESLLNDIERALVEGLLPDFDGMAALRSAQAPEIITLDWDFKEPDRLERIKSERKRVRLLNRRLFEHPAVEAARILKAANRAKDHEIETVVYALKTYIQSAEAISALTNLQANAPETFTKCVALLADTDADIRLPTNFASFDKQWNSHWKGKSAPAVLKYLQEHGLSGTEFGDRISGWNASDAGRLTQVVPQTISLLEMLVAHLAILEYRIRSFCIIIGNAAVTKSWKCDLADNLAGLWRDRTWDRIFSHAGIIDNKRKSFDPGLKWTGQLINALNRHPKAKSYFEEFQKFLAEYEIQVARNESTGSAELTYKSSLPAWLRVGNLALPLEVIRGNLMDRLALLPEQKHSGQDVETLEDGDDASDPRELADESSVTELVARCRNGDTKACRALVDECGWSRERVSKLLSADNST